MFLGSRGFPRERQEAQESSQEAPKELQSRNKKGSKNWPKDQQVLDRFWDYFGAHFGIRLAREWTKMSSRRLSRASKTQKPASAKIGKINIFLVFFGSKAAQDRLKEPKKAPKRHPKTSKASTKRDQK